MSFPALQREVVNISKTMLALFVVFDYILAYNASSDEV